MHKIHIEAIQYAKMFPKIFQINRNMQAGSATSFLQLTTNGNIINYVSAMMSGGKESTKRQKEKIYVKLRVSGDYAIVPEIYLYEQKR